VQTSTAGDDTTLRTIDIEFTPERINTQSEGQFVDAELSFPREADLNKFKLGSVAIDGVTAVTDTQYGFVRNIPVEVTEESFVMSVKFPRQELIETLETGQQTPQVMAATNDTVFRGSGSLEIFDPGNGNSDNADRGGGPSGNGRNGGGPDN